MDLVHVSPEAVASYLVAVEHEAATMPADKADALRAYALRVVESVKWSAEVRQLSNSGELRTGSAVVTD